MDLILDNSIPEPNTGCWIWVKNGKRETSYGTLSLMGKVFRAHRLSWILYNEKPIPKDYVICHKCDVPCCVNPDHLFLGTQSDNMNDRQRKGRNILGPVWSLKGRPYCS